MHAVAYFVSFGPHGHRAPAGKPGDNLKIAASVAGLLGVSYLMMLGVKAMGESFCSAMLD